MLKVHWEEVPHNWVRGTKDRQTPAFKILRAMVPGGWLVTLQETLCKL